jgi:hypothetical protein
LAIARQPEGKRLAAHGANGFGGIGVATLPAVQ